MGRVVDALPVKKSFRTDWKGGKMPGRRWKYWQDEAVLKGNLKGNLTVLIYKKGNKDKGGLAKMKVRPISKVFKDFNLEDDLSIEDN